MPSSDENIIELLRKNVEDKVLAFRKANEAFVTATDLAALAQGHDECTSALQSAANFQALSAEAGKSAKEAFDIYADAKALAGD